MIKANHLMEINKLILAITVTLFGIQIGNAQKESVKVTAIGFYNLENLFDIEDDPVIWDVLALFPIITRSSFALYRNTL